MTGVAVNGVASKLTGKGGLLNEQNLNNLTESEAKEVNNALTSAYAGMLENEGYRNIEEYRKQAEKTNANKTTAITHALAIGAELSQTIKNRIGQVGEKAAQIGKQSGLTKANRGIVENEEKDSSLGLQQGLKTEGEGHGALPNHELQAENADVEAMGTRNKRMAKKENAPKPGQKISSEEHETFRARMKELNFDTVGFESYCGDTEVLGNIHQSLTKLRTDYADVLGEKALKIRYVDLQETDTFAMINKNDPNTIRFNKRIYDDTAYLKAEYQKYMELGYFVKGTDYRSVAYHEMGHVLNRLLGTDKTMTRVVEQKAKEYSLSSKDFLEKYVSKYASDYDNLAGTFDELLPEIISGLYNSNDPQTKSSMNELFNSLMHLMSKKRGK